MRFTRNWAMGTTFGLCAALAGAACGDAESPKPQGLDEFGVNESELGVAVGDCSSGTGGWTSSNKTPLSRRPREASRKPRCGTRQDWTPI